VDRCANCNATLTGPYCAQCGQHAYASARSMSVLLQDGWHVMTHLDSRLWRTLGALVARPGQLTREYFLDHRERYLPPVRLYLVLSILFFATVGFGARSGEPIVINDASEVAVGAGSKCSELTGTGVIERWLRATCDRVAADHGASIGAAVRSNLPRMMFVFLPVPAGVLKLLYWRPRRLYVEHLVFFLHTHAAMYLAILAVTAINALDVRLTGASAGPLGWLQLLLWLYMIWYLYRAMRVTYQQSGRRTAAKLALVGVAYMLCFALMLGLTTVVSLLVSL